MSEPEIRSAIVALIRPALLAIVPTLAIQDDPNMAFEPPSDAPWARITFQDGEEAQVSIGGENSLWREPILVFTDAFIPLSKGDGLALLLTKAAKDATRRQSVTGARWLRFMEGAEGKEDPWYRKQAIAVFQRSKRV